MSFPIIVAILNASTHLSHALIEANAGNKAAIFLCFHFVNVVLNTTQQNSPVGALVKLLLISHEKHSECFSFQNSLETALNYVSHPLGT